MAKTNGGLLPIAALFLGISFSGCSRSIAPNPQANRAASDIVEVEVTPLFRFQFDRMQVGVLQHIDRDYTYDVITPELESGLLFQGIHRPPIGTSITLKVLAPATIYFFFHDTVHGGYDQIFAELDGWQRCKNFPQYDIHHGDHGLKMVMYRLNAEPGVYEIPATTADRACFNFVVQMEKLASPARRIPTSS